MATLTIFANYYINHEERFLRLKDSFQSFKDIKAEKWVINVRGKYGPEVLAYLGEHLGDRLIGSLIETKHGWLHDTRKMLEHITTDFVFIWLEDHINMVDVSTYETILSEMKESGSEYMSYSWWHFGKPLQVYADVPKKEMKSIYTFTLDKKNLTIVESKHSTFILSMVGIFSTKLFGKLITETSLFMRQYSKWTPFNIEKGAAETKWLPVAYALPKQELFASIDADTPEGGYSLQSRGLYPTRASRETTNPETPKKQDAINAKKYIPPFIYSRLIKVVIFINRVKKYIKLIIKDF